MAQDQVEESRRERLGGDDERAVTPVKKGTIGAYLNDVVLSMLFPVWVLWLGPRYLLRGELLKGIVLILIVAVEMTVALLLLTS